ncbi:MAG: Rieske (2Fe-2S) protein [Verrucomicrobia bacterium]|nr:Rieske (2Fe-2S) protein [Verrucomicrobiota bacterium]
MAVDNQVQSPSRRGWLGGMLAAGLAAFATGFPVALGVRCLLDPLRRKRRAPELFVRIANLSALPADGAPRRFPVLSERVNVWTKTRGVPVGAVFLRRLGEASVEAFNVVCPHAGCVVQVAAEGGGYLCPCHNSAFGLDGRIADPGSPSPRGLDALATELRHGEEVWVKFQNFRTGVRDQIPI